MRQEISNAKLTNTMEHDLNLFVLEDHSDGVLNLNDLRFFYYDIGMDTLTGIPCLYVDNNEVISLKRNRKLVLKALEQSQLPETFQDNHIYFVQESSDKTEIDSFFRHLRNAFSHYHIHRYGEYFYMNDYYDNKDITMVGKIKCNDLVDLCNLYFKQREELLNEKKTI